MNDLDSREPWPLPVGGASPAEQAVQLVVPTDELVQRMKAAIEGECAGLAITDDHARAILEYVLAAAPSPEAPTEPDLVQLVKLLQAMDDAGSPSIGCDDNQLLYLRWRRSDDDLVSLWIRPGGVNVVVFYGSENTSTTVGSIAEATPLCVRWSESPPIAALAPSPEAVPAVTPFDSPTVTTLWQGFGRGHEFRQAVQWAQEGEIPGALFVAYRRGLSDALAAAPAPSALPAASTLGVPPSGSGSPLQAEPSAAIPNANTAPQRLWLWKNFVDGRHEYWAFDNPFPVYPDSDDPQTLGEPCGYALVKPSRTGRTDVSDEEVLRRIAAAQDGKR